MPNFDLQLDLQSFNLQLGLLIFLAYFVIDGLYAYYTYAVVSKKPYAAATIGASMYLLSALGVISYIHNILYLVPLIVGSWLGTFLVVSKKHHSRR
jgi:hypothetical protein